MPCRGMRSALDYLFPVQPGNERQHYVSHTKGLLWQAPVLRHVSRHPDGYLLRRSCRSGSWRPWALEAALRLSITTWRRSFSPDCCAVCAGGSFGGWYRLSMSDDATTLTEDIAIAAPAAQAGRVAPISGKAAPAAAGMSTRLYTNAQPKLVQMRRWMAREMSMAVTTPARLLPISTIPAASIAMSVPLPIAMPRSACARAGASLMPSPTIATVWPCSCSSLTCRALLPGITSAMTYCRGRPRPSATEYAVR
mmetsp:Transcript_29329/g.73590  ORF Transcript_29329/g.73590 Transcript_29329/m.73590 type:complete len:252 (-) Transcript_29329:3166-3921(-)